MARPLLETHNQLNEGSVENNHFKLLSLLAPRSPKLWIVENDPRLRDGMLFCHLAFSPATSPAIRHHSVKEIVD